MFYTYKNFISSSYSYVKSKHDSLSKRPGNEGIEILEHTLRPEGDFRWVGPKPNEDRSPFPFAGIQRGSEL